MPKHKSDFARGLEVMLNDPRTSPFTAEGSKVFKEVISAADLPLTEALKYIGKGKKKVKQPTDKEKSEQRIEKLEETQKS
jgi:ribosomal protein L7/L12